MPQAADERAVPFGTADDAAPLPEPGRTKAFAGGPDLDLAPAHRGSAVGDQVPDLDDRGFATGCPL